MVSSMLKEEPATFKDIRPHIFVVDDDPDNCNLLTQIIKREYRVSTAQNGLDALTFLKDNPDVDTILLDIMMPNMNGLQTLQRLRDNPETSNIPVILISALNNNDDVVAGLDIGAKDYITKPFDRRVLLARIRTQVELKQLTDAQADAIVKLKTSQALRDNLFSVVSHDLKNPLANIRMVEYVLREQVEADTTTMQMMDAVKLSLDTMQQVIDDFLDVVTLQSGKLKLNYKLKSTEATICSVVLQYNMNAKNKNIDVDLKKIDDTVWVDEHKLQQILSNLLSNALKYSPNDSTIAIWTEQLDGIVRINVADEGPGVPIEEQHKLFTEFGKLSPRPTGDESSTGLGLWIVKTVTELMNGRVGADFPKDGGSIFWVEFPTKPDDKSHSTTAS